MKAKKTTWRVLATMLILVLAVSMLAGCSKPKSVEEAIAKDEKAKKQIESIADQNGMEIKIEGNTVTYLVKLDSEVDKELIETYKSAFDEAFKEQEKTMVDAVKQLEDELEIKGVIFAVKVTDSKDQTVYETTFDANGMKS